MKIIEVVGGSPGSDTVMLKPPQQIRRLKRPPQVGYGIQVGNQAIPTPGYNPDNDLGQINSVVGG